MTSKALTNSDANSGDAVRAFPLAVGRGKNLERSVISAQSRCAMWLSMVGKSNLIGTPALRTIL